MAEVELTGVKKIYGKKVVAVKDFNLKIKDKEFVVFVGPSGCGKSTTLRMIAGLEDITEGTVKIGGRVVNDLKPKDRGVSMVFQNYALYPNYTIFKNIAFPLTLMRVPVEVPIKDKAGNVTGVKIKMRRLTSEEIANKVAAVAEILGITEYLSRRPRELSGGQKQRVAIGRAMVKGSSVFLLDEPLSNLDAKLRAQMRSELIELRKKIDTTFIYVTHDQVEAMTLADRIVIMKDGVIQQVGTPTELFDMPSNLFVAEFIGSPKMNTFRTNLEQDEEGYFVTLCGVKKHIVGERGAALQKRGIQPQEVIFGVRPEHISLSNHENPEAIPCVIKVSENMGSSIHLHVKTEMGDELIVRVPKAPFTAAQIERLVSGNRIYITFESKSMHFFSAETQVNLLVDDAPAVGSAAVSEQQAEEPRKKWRRIS